MITFDTRSAFLLLGSLYLLLSSLTWLMLVKQRKPQTALWCGGGMMAGLGLIVAGLDESQSPWFATTLATALLLLSHLVRIQSFRMDLGISWSTQAIMCATVAATLIPLAINLGLPAPMQRLQLTALINALCLAYLALLAWRIGREEQSPNIKWIALAFCLVALALLFWTYSSWQTDGTGSLRVDGAIVNCLLLATLLGGMVEHLGHLGLALDRALRRESKAAKEKASQIECSHLSDTIAQLDRLQSLTQMSASISHELSQPLTATLVNAEIAKRNLQTGLLDTPKHTELLEKIIRSTHRTSQTIERIRNVIRPAGIKSESVNITQILRNAGALVGNEALSRDVVFRLPNPEPAVWVTGDPLQLAQVVINVFRNATQAMAQSAQREVLASHVVANGRMTLDIQDTGPGLSVQALAKAGTPFFTTKQNGLGLGLAISRSIAAQHGGTLTIANVSDKHNSGAMVELNLPALVCQKP